MIGASTCNPMLHLDAPCYIVFSLSFNELNINKHFMVGGKAGCSYTGVGGKDVILKGTGLIK